MIKHKFRIGYRLTPYGFQLKQENTSGVLAARDVTGDTIKAQLIRVGGSVVLAATETGITMTDVTEGQGYFQLPETLDGGAAWSAGEYYLYIIVDDGTNQDSHPVDPVAIIEAVA